MNRHIRVNIFLRAIVFALVLAFFSIVANAAGDERLQKPYESLQQLDALFDRGDWLLLNQIGSQYVRAYEKDAKQFAAVRSFFYVLPNEGYPEILEGYNAWVKRFPNSYVALYARARYYAYQAMAARGEDTINKVSGEKLKQMEAHFSAAESDLLRSLELSSRPTMTYFQLIRIARYYGSPKMARTYYEKSAEIDPDVLMLADEYLYSAQPRWGGSFKELHNFPDEALKRGLSAEKAAKLKTHARLLEGQDYLLYEDKEHASKMFSEVVKEGASKEYVAPALIELGRMADSKRDFETSSRYYGQALKLQPNNVRVLVSLAAARRDANFPHEALALYDRAIAIASDDMWALTGRGWLQHKILGNNDAAFPDILKAARLGESYAQNILGYLYWEGKGVGRNQSEALYWWTLSDKQKNLTAEENLKMAKRKLGDRFEEMLNAALLSKRPMETRAAKPKFGLEKKPGTGLDM